MPLPVCRRARARRSRKVRGRDFCGYCAAKREKFFGFRLHLVCTPGGVPVSFAIVAGGYHDLTPLHELTFVLPAGACVFGDKGYNSAPDEATILAEIGVRVIPIRRRNILRRSTLNWRRWARSSCTRARTPASRLRFTLLCWRWRVQTSTSNQGKNT